MSAATNCAETNKQHPTTDGAFVSSQTNHSTDFTETMVKICKAAVEKWNLGEWGRFCKVNGFDEKFADNTWWTEILDKEIEKDLEAGFHD